MPLPSSRPGLAGTGRVLVGAIVCALGLVTVLPHQTGVMWRAGLVAAEWGHWLGVLGLPLLIGVRRTWLHGGAAVLTLIGIVLLLSPVVMAMRVADRLPPALEEAFGAAGRLTTTDTPPRPAPLVMTDLFLGASAGDVLMDEHVYDVVDGDNLTLDLYRPRFGVDPRPVVIVVHGGGWSDGSKRDLPTLSRYLAARGYVVANIDYRLAPRWAFPAPQEDIVSAIRYLRTLETTHGVDPQRIALLGRSVGGQIALLAAYRSSDPAIRGVVSLYGPTALRWGYHNPAPAGLVDSSRLLEQYLGGPPETHGNTYDAAEPAMAVTPATPPTLLLHGLRDAHVSPLHAELLSARLLRADVAHVVVRLPWASHGCDYVFSGPCGQVTTFAIERFLGSVLHGSGSP